MNNKKINTLTYTTGNKPILFYKLVNGLKPKAPTPEEIAKRIIKDYGETFKKLSE